MVILSIEKYEYHMTPVFWDSIYKKQNGTFLTNRIMCVVLKK